MKEELIQKLEWEDFESYKITFPTISNAITNTITKGEGKERQILEIIENNPSLSKSPRWSDCQ